MLELGRGHTIKQLLQASAELCTPPIQTQQSSRKATGLFSKTTQRDVWSKKANQNHGHY